MSQRSLANDELRSIETTNAATIDAVSLSEVIIRKKDHGIMQLACNNLGARMAQDAFVSIGWCIGMAGFWGQSLFDNDAGKGESLLL